MAADNPRAALISVDWGTSSLRAVLAGPAGEVLDRRASGEGIRHVPGGDFEAALRAMVLPWIAANGPLPVIASGMIGSRNGWREVPYRACPASAGDLASGLVEVTTIEGAPVLLVPGVSDDPPGSIPDVMRGEECQILGALAAAVAEAGRFVLPGTHSKWATAEDGRIVAFATMLTGEVYAVLRRHTILGALAEGDADDEHAFGEGVLAARDSSMSGGLLHLIFGARTLVLFGRLPPVSVAAWLSGALIGSELTTAPGDRGGAAEPVTIVGEAALAARYQRAAALLGLPSRLAPPDVVVHGHLAVARQARIMA